MSCSLQRSIAHTEKGRNMAGFKKKLAHNQQKKSTMKLAPLLLMAIIGYGCAAKKMAAQNADVLIQNQMEKKLPLYSAQKESLAKDIDKFLNAQKQFAKEVVPVLTSIELDARKVDDQYDHLTSLYKKLALNFSKLMSQYMAPLDEKQQKDFSKNLKEDNQRIARLKGEEQIEKIEERFERLFGTISDKQKKIFESEQKYFEERQALRLGRREKLHAKFEEIYKMDLSNDARAKSFVEAFTEYQNTYPESPKNKEIIKAIIPTLSKEQRETFEEKTNDIKEIIGYYLETDY